MEQRTSKEVFQVAGDSPDPTGTGARGLSTSYDLTRTAAGHPVLVWRAPNGQDMLLTADVYAIPGAPMYIHILCPMCAINGHQHALLFDQSQKGMTYERMTPPPPFRDWSSDDIQNALAGGIDIKSGGRLSVEPFACTWEETGELERGFGLGRCTWKVFIDNNVVKSA